MDLHPKAGEAVSGRKYKETECIYLGFKFDIREYKTPNSGIIDIDTIAAQLESKGNVQISPEYASMEI